MARKKGRRSKPYKLNLKKDTTNSVLAVILMGIGGLIAISFSQQGDLLTKINEIGQQFFGWPLLFLPFIFIVGGLIITHVKLAIASTHVLLGSVVTMVSLSGLFGTGSLGLGIKESVVSLISVPGTILFYLVGTVIGIFILFETSIEDLLVLVRNIVSGLDVVTRKLRGLVGIKGNTPTFLNKSNTVKITGGDEPVTTISRQTVEPVKIVSRDLGHTTQAVLETRRLPDGASAGVWQYPPLTLLSDQKLGKADRGDINNNIEIIQNTLASFGIQAKVMEVHQGPAVSQYALAITMGTKLSKISALQSDLALALSAPQGQIRIEAPIPGRDLVGIEIPNRSLEFVSLREMLSKKVMQENRSKTAFSLGLDVSGQEVVADLAKMPHLLIAGTTGSGKSVLINAIISSILFRASPEEVKFIMVDPKRVELTPYNDIPHLLTRVITDVSKVSNALGWLVVEMEKRYRLFEELKVKNIAGYNETIGFQTMPFIIVIVDEMADIMMSKNAGEIEEKIVRLAQMARAVGIHLILSTQRPSVNILTGIIKANIPARIAFQVTSMIDSRVIIDTPGAEKLLGKGDMLYVPPDIAKPKRIQGAFVSDKEIKTLLDFIRRTGVTSQMDDTIIKAKESPGTLSASGQNLGDVDDKFEEAAHLVIAEGKGSASLLQRRLEIGYARAARILDQLEMAGVLAHAEGNKPREIIVSSLSEVFPGEDNS
ncbi:MAG: cell division FtsK/SpoIIIE [Candidatus Collierbacteria bacterium GW2011_GWB1_45_35]|uniref:Cell division FtsK/SpoIIIE n=2 Tax=Candidatus Collieribacteriota TaxID=1752725 RepID=A0A837IFV4_9BACT|nr:MAG: cell division FtsK/SpoIIIE [Microgenomates group bacterium GW2011_GWC1_44_23]KKT96138.1 MAG: cell division FtsK/SpoIIIE [Candidatus Collierbacteria bacterium GW2011_GWA1_45_15]KKU01178.1 MAG: cell division FtsK/SpoIIIE [Candidatus Collierbacteria bacterium GW2011_GWB2_45_17]KKU05394.1 MAG: cell division FtsK/SpoIIIE [Candidatus Collierbacteria bacterium GW2011_GWB1_45_35]KKU06626.1 MAG: cell division FtsK/SpoIIIE [Candidatus Collierbacteria bacterium GW2011_GWC2_45_40]HBC44881.1 DNA tr